ncbi:hypothetical protein KHA80_17900 [Anaerobacillus sp. HL2]|nr:hypothetical protein KHA80_17900 [Anaerobacillus sp. HL2]
MYISLILHLNNTIEWQLADDLWFPSVIYHATRRTSGELLPNQNGNWELPHSHSKMGRSGSLSLLSLLATTYSFVDKQIEKTSLKDFSSTFINTYVNGILQTDDTVLNAYNELHKSQPSHVKNRLSEIQRRPNNCPANQKSTNYF